MAWHQMALNLPPLHKIWFTDSPTVDLSRTPSSLFIYEWHYLPRIFRVFIKLPQRGSSGIPYFTIFVTVRCISFDEKGRTGALTPPSDFMF